MSTWRTKVAAAQPAAAPRVAAAPGAAAAGRVSKNARRGGAASRAKRAAHAGAGAGARPRRKSAPSLRAQIRALRRTLAHRGAEMAPAARAEKEAEIAALAALADDRARRERERELAKKYHMVKFFERRKLQRRLEKVTAMLRKKEAAGEAGEAGDAGAGAGAAMDDLAERKKALEADLFYVQNFPRDKPYVALFPSAGHTDESRAEVEKMRTVILAAGSVSGGVASTSVGPPGVKKDGAASASASDSERGAASSEGEDDFFLEDC